MPPVLEIYVLWHPRDTAGQKMFEAFFEHFHGTAFSGLLGGAIEVYARSSAWQAPGDAPRPIPRVGAAAPAALALPRFVAVVPLLGNELADAVEGDGVEGDAGSWHEYLNALVDAEGKSNGSVGIFPLLIDDGADVNTALGSLFGKFQQLGRPDPNAPPEPPLELRCRDLAQSLAQMLRAPEQEPRLTVFISHTKRAAVGEEDDVGALIAAVRTIIGNTRLGAFFDANELQPGQNWDGELRRRAASCAFLAVRTDLYASREWCQREMLIAKAEGMPIVVLDALGRGELRGSFLLDHVPRMPVRRDVKGPRIEDVRRALNMLVDECLKRALWSQQRQLAQARLSVAWWAPHAPEPATLSRWLIARRKPVPPPRVAELLILHPDPPLGPCELDSLRQLVELSGAADNVDILTPRTLAARGG